MRTFNVAIFGSVILTGILISFMTASTGFAGDNKKLPKIDEVAHYEGLALRVTSAKTTDSLDSDTRAKDGYRFVILEVEIFNWRSSESPYNRLYFSVKDSKGYEYSTTGYVHPKALSSGTIRSDDKVRGYITFEVDRAAKDLVLTYEPWLIFGDYKPLRILLKKQHPKSRKGQSKFH